MWIKIEHLEKHIKGRGMFVVKGFDVEVQYGGFPYTTDPYCVWKNDDGTFARWPHPFPPTHFAILPVVKE